MVVNVKMDERDLLDYIMSFFDEDNTIEYNLYKSYYEELIPNMSYLDETIRNIVNIDNARSSIIKKEELENYEEPDILAEYEGYLLIQ